ncbi:UNVERIFIED_CONTAM: hypothetical protein PYX00_007728 [Menopon gallinae]|uniref:Ciliogenesis-associated TTC17-interacting protein N-terminal domain-containing protein n=1 Tax=Menopon gallinae TaxID=328185 RepID=A0AAW2HL49_9NEOP
MDLRRYNLTTYGDTKRLLSINEVLCNLILFKEKLYVFNEEGKRVGRFSITVDTTDILHNKAMVVHISNRTFIPENESETTITGVVSLSMKTLEEIRCESSEVMNAKHERRFYLLRESTNYYYSIHESVCDITSKRPGTIPFKRTRGLICEAANIVLMRSLAVRGFEGILCLKTILSNGKTCRNYYVTKLGMRYVSGVKQQVMTIFRSVTDHKTHSVTAITVLTRAGQMLHTFWSNSNFFLHVDPDLEINGNIVHEGKPVEFHRHWNRDKQVFSYYLDKKLELISDIKSYKAEHQEIKRVFADWVQFILIMKPEDTICSALEYFTSFGVDTGLLVRGRRKRKIT